MVLKNNTKNVTVANDFEICSSLHSKIMGLMFSPKKNLIFAFEKEKKIDLHMLFVFFPIWAVYLDSAKKVVAMKKLLPFISYCSPDVKAKYILELCKKPDLAPGDFVSW